MTSETTNKFATELRERAARVVFDHAGSSIAIGDGGIDCEED